MFFKNLLKKFSYQEIAPYEIETHDKITVLVMEYQNLHQRVTQHVEMGRQDTLQALIFAGGILFFSINCFYDIRVELFVNISMCILIPIVVFSLVASILSINIKICSYGEYLATIEQRINRILLYSTDANAPADKKIVDWERWRITHGIAQDKIIFFDGALLYISLIPGAFLSFVIRLVYLNNNAHSYLRFWVLFTPILFAIFLTVLIILLRKLEEYRTRVKNIISHGEIEYKNLDKVSFLQKFRSTNKLLLTIVGLYVSILMLLFTFIPFSFSIRNNALIWLDNQVIAHRGLHDTEYPENTLSAFSNAIAHGYAIEMDIWFSKDMVPVVIHDKEVERLCKANRKIKDMTFEEICQLTVMGKEKIPTLQDSLALISGKVPVMIEIKAYFPSEEENQILADLLVKYNGAYTIQSFSPLPLYWMSNHYPNIPRGQLYADWGMFSSKWIFNIRDNLFNLISTPNYIGYDKSAIVYASSMNQAREQGIPTVGWLFEIDADGKIYDTCYSVDGYIVEIIQTTDKELSNEIL